MFTELNSFMNLDSSPSAAGKIRCEACKKKCSGDILKSDNKYFHIDCFVCKACKQRLQEQGFFVQNGDYYCPSDYRAKFGIRCAECKQYVEGDVVRFLDASYHPECFRCCHCNKEIPSGNITYNGRDRICQQCSNKMTAELKVSSPTPGESQPDLVDGISSPVGCAGCGQGIRSGQVLLALNAQWHTWCFKCSICQCVLHGEYMEREGLPYCIRDYEANFGVKCHNCGNYINGKVFQAGEFHFHPNCARCNRCDALFDDGEEMYMQGDEIWHPHCNNMMVEQIAHGPPRSPRSPYVPKYSTDFGRHLLYMYLLPEPNMGYLKQPVSPHPPQTPQFHTPQGKEVKIRRSRISMFKSGMQKLAETLEEATPRPRSPAMNNEEPIELSHYPGAYVPAPNKVPPIERDDFPAPPFPYAVDEYKRRLSSTSPTAEDEEELVDNSKIEKGEQELKKFQDECSIAKVVAQQLEEHMRKMKIPSHVDPRSASRTPSAKKIPYLKCRYESPVNASPSRYLNRPRPWEWWDKDRRATATIPYAQVPKPGYGLAPKAATLPTTYFSSYYDFVDYNTTLTSEFSERSGVTSPTFSYYERYQPSYEPCVLRSSLPDMSKPLKTYNYSQLTIDNKKLPEDVDRCHLERHLSRAEFESLFGMTPIEFYKLPDWKRINMKRKLKLF